MPGSTKLNKVQIPFENLWGSTKSSKHVKNEKKKIADVENKVMLWPPLIGQDVF